MKREDRKQQRTVEALTPEAWDRKVNEVLLTLPHNTRHMPTMERTVENGVYRAVIDYYVQVEEPEDAQDRAHLAGIRYTCADCPHLIKVEDRRVKRLTCDRTGEYTRHDMDACVWYYERMEREGTGNDGTV